MRIIFILVLAGFIVLLQIRSRKRGTDGISYDCKTSSSLVECDESFQLISILKNQRRFPVLFLRLLESVPSRLQLETPDSGVSMEVHNHLGAATEYCLSQVLHLMPRQKLTRTLTVKLQERGCYVFGHAFLQTGDILGLEEYETALSSHQEVVVIPKRAQLSSFDQAYANWYGDISVRRFILPDPILTVGFHEYSGREPMKDISWPRTLRSDKLMIREYDHTSEPAATVILNIGGTDKRVAEECYSTMRTVCEKLYQENITYSVVSNVSTPSGVSNLLRVNDGCGHQHLMEVLEGLGRASASTYWSFQYLLDHYCRQDNTNRGYILVSPTLTSEATMHLRRFEAQTGQKVLCITVEGGSAS